MFQSQVEGETVYLSELKKEELPKLLELYEDEAFMDDFGYIEGVVQTYESLCTWYEELQSTEGEVFYSIYESKSQEWIGFISLMDIDKEVSEGWLVIGLIKSKREKGLGQAAMICLIQEAFDNGIEMIRLSVLSHNERAIRLYKRLGFKLEMIYPKGKCPNLFGVDIIEWSLNVTDYANK